MSFSPIPASLNSPASSTRNQSDQENVPMAAFWDRVESPEFGRQSICASFPQRQIKRPVFHIQDSDELGAVFQRVFPGSKGILSPEKERILEKVANFDTLTDAQKLFILENSLCIEEMKEEFILELFTSLKKPVHSPYISRLIKQEENIKALFYFCWNNQLLRSFGKLSNRIPSLGLLAFIQAELNESVTPGKLKMLSELLPYFTISPSTVPYIFPFIRGLSEELLALPEIESLKREFLSHECACEYLTDSTTEVELDDLILGFEFYWQKLDPSSNDLGIIQDICHKIYLLDPSYVNSVIRFFLKNNPQSLPKSVIPTMDCLTPGTTQWLRKQIGMLVFKNKASEEAIIEFLDTAYKQSLMAWSFSVSPPLRTYKWIAKGTQIGRDGAFDSHEAFKIAVKLNEMAPQEIDFNLSQIHRWESLNGGVCSAMTFRTVKLYRAERAQSETPLEALKAISPHIRIATPELRTIQIAYNSIQKKADAASIDFKKAKIEALLKYENPDLSIVHSSNVIDLKSLAAAASIKAEFDQLPEGLFVVRALCPLAAKENYKPTSLLLKKEEEYGHSTFLIKEAGETFYYDPAVGILQFNQPAEQLAMILDWQQDRWNLGEVRFYQVASAHALHAS